MAVDGRKTLPLGLAFSAADGARVSLAQIRNGAPAGGAGGGKGIVVYFMRAATCPICLHHVRTLARLAGGLRQRGVLLVVVVPGDADDAASVRVKAGPGVTVLSSTGVDAHEAAGLGRAMLMQQSGTFLVDGAGQTRYVKTATMPTGSFDERELMAAIEAL